MNKNGNAFIFINRYLDLYESIEYGGQVDEDKDLLVKQLNFIIQNTNIPQKDVYLSAKNIIGPLQKEELHKWILEKTLDKGLDKKLSTVNCKKCGESMFEVI